MTGCVVTRNGQVTLAKSIREQLGIEEGDVVSMHVMGDTVMITKNNSRAFESRNFLPKKHSYRAPRHHQIKRLKRLGIL